MRSTSPSKPLAFVVRIALSIALSLGAQATCSAAVGTHSNITYIEGSRVPDVVLFQVDQPVGNCPVGAYLLWEGGSALPRGTTDDSMRRANVRYIAQTLQLQKAINAKVVVWATAVTNVTQFCVVENIHVPQ